MLKPIKNDVQYEGALARIYELMQKELKPESKESDELEVLSILVKEYELDHYPMPKPSPLEAIKFRLEQMGMSEAQLSDIFSAQRKIGKFWASYLMCRALVISKNQSHHRYPAYH